MARIVLAARPGLDASAIRHGHEIVGRASSSGELIEVVGQVAPEVVVTACDPVTLSSGVLAACDIRGIRVVALVSNEAGRKYAAALGLYDVVDEPAEWPDIERVLAGARTVTAPSGSRGTVIAVWGPAGSPGRSTLAIGIAAELASAGHSVVLGDVDTHAASIAPSLGLLDEAPGFAAACRLAGSDSLDLLELERIAQRYSTPHGGFWVLTGLGRPARWPELPADRVLATIAKCRDWVDFVVLDTGFSLENDEEISSDLYAPRRNASTITALRDADIVVAVGSADPVGLSRFLRAHVDLIELITTSRLIVVANKVRATAIGLNPQSQVLQTLSRFGGIERPVLIPHDQLSLDAALLSGRTLAEVAAKSPVRLAVQELVQKRILPAVKAKKPKKPRKAA